MMESDPVGYFFCVYGAVYLFSLNGSDLSFYLYIIGRCHAGCGKAVVGSPSISPAVITVGVSSIYNRGFFAPWRCGALEIMQLWSGLPLRLSLHHAAVEP